MNKTANSLLKSISTIALKLAAGSMLQASTIFTHQPKIDDNLKNALLSLK